MTYFYILNHLPQYGSPCHQFGLSQSPLFYIVLTPFNPFSVVIRVAQFSCSVVSDSLGPHGLKHTRPPCLSPTPGAYWNSCPLSWWWHPNISSSSSPSPPKFTLSQHQGLFKWVSSPHQVAKVLGVSASVLPMNIQDWFPLGLTGLISLLSKELSRVFPKLHPYINFIFKRGGGRGAKLSLEKVLKI